MRLSGAGRRDAPPQRAMGLRLAGRAREMDTDRPDLLSGQPGPSRGGAAMDDPALHHQQQQQPPPRRFEQDEGRWGPPREPRGYPDRPPTGPRELFPEPPRGPRAQQQQIANDQLRQAAKQSILSRVGVPNPRAAEFVPGAASRPPTGGPDSSSGAGPSLLDRLEPRTLDQRVTRQIDVGAFPTQPREKEACNYLLKCTNPMCSRSHPTPCLANTAKEDSAMMLSEEACNFGAKCTNQDCSRSHPSPAVSVLASKAMAMQAQLAFFQQQQQMLAARAQPEWARASPPQSRSQPFGSGNTVVLGGGDDGVNNNEASRSNAPAINPLFTRDPNAGRPPPCKYQQGCTNPQCAYSHYDANGKITASPALARLASGAPPPTAAPGADAEMSNGDQTAVAQPAAIDRPLSDAPAQGNMRPCRFGTACTRPDCIFSHPSGRRIDSTVSSSSAAGGGGVPCKFGAACYRPDCHFAHPPGRIVQGQQSSSSSSQTHHVSERLQAFSQQASQANGDVERIIPATS